MTQAYPNAPMPAAQPRKSSGLAIAALVLGILSVVTCGVLSLPALIVSIIAVAKKGGGMAVGGLIASILSLLVIGGMLAAGGFAAIFAKDAARMARAVAEAQVLSRAVMVYSTDYNGMLPDADWETQLAEYRVETDELDNIPWADADQEPYTFALNAGVAGRRIDEIVEPTRTVLFFECRPGSPPVGGRELLPDEPRFKVYVMSYTDGHVEPVAPEQLGNLKWTAE